MYEDSSQMVEAQTLAECLPDSLGGVFSFILLLALPLAVLLTWLTILLYKNKVSRVMREVSRHAETGNTGSTVESSSSIPSRQLKIKTFNDESRIQPTLKEADSSRKLSRTTAAYALAGLAQAIVVSALTFYLSKTEFLPIRFASTVFLYLWPVVPTLILTSVSDSRVKWGSLGTYFFFLVALDLGLNFGGLTTVSNPGALLQVWMIWMGPPTVLLWVLSNRAWRSVGLLAYLVAVALVTGWLVSTQGLACWALASNNPSLWTVFRWPLLIAAVILTGGLAWWGLKWISARYQAKRLSDQSLTLASWWLVITLVEIVIQFDATGGASVSFIVGWFLYLWISRGMTAGSKTESPTSLLLLRVFGHRRRSRKFLDQLGQRWRYIGPINLIGAPDVAATNLEPDELLQFWSGRARDLFVSNDEDLNRRLHSLDMASDPDGRFRINDFFCYDNTWRETVMALAENADAILMDLRGFGPNNRGCEFELGMLLSEVSLSKTILLVDATTDQGALKNLLLKLWKQLPNSSPNHNLEKPEIRIFEASGPVHSIRPLLSLLTKETSKAPVFQGRG